MPVPTASDVHVNTLLTEMSIQFTQDNSNFVCDKVFPKLKVKKQSDKYAKWSMADFFRIQAQQRADGDKAIEAGFRVDTSSTYFAEVYALSKVITDRQRANYDSPLDADRAIVNFLTQQLLMKRDAVFFANAMTTGIWTGIYTGVSGSPSSLQFKQWNDSASTPVYDIRMMRRAVQLQCGRAPNKLVVTADVHDVLMENADVVGRIKYAERGIITEDILTQLFGMEYIVAQGGYNSAAENQTASLALQGTKRAMMCYTPSTPSHDEPAAGYTFSWADFDGIDASGGAALTVVDVPERGKGAQLYVAEMAFDACVTSADCGLYMTTAIA